MSDSGAPKHWPFMIVEPGDFKLPERAVNSVRIHHITDLEHVKEELAEAINEEFLLAGWHGIGYHYVIDKEGNICTGRPLDESPIADSVSNPTAISIAAYAHSEKTVESVERFTQAISEAFTLARKSMKVTVDA